MAIAPSFSHGTFIETTAIFDILQLAENSQNPELQELAYRLYYILNNLAIATNLKDSGYYDVNQYISGRLYFPNPVFNSGSKGTPVYRPVMRVVVNFGALPNAATKSVAHFITCIPGGTTFTQIYATASKTTAPLSYIPIPFASPILNENIKITVDDTNVNITTAIDYSAYTVCYVVLEFILN